MVAEFTRFAQMIASNDRAAADKAFQHSIDVLSVLKAAKESMA
jgi:hypothetical protein